MKKTSLPECYAYVDEMPTYDPSVTDDRMIRRDTEWIAKSAVTPLFNTNYGTVVNDQCMHLDSYSITHDLFKN